MTDNVFMTRFGLLRHASTVWNLEKRIQGQHDSPLTKDGESQAAKWGRHLAVYTWDRIISSDLGRSVKTAALVNTTLQVPITTDSRLREQDWGEWTGKTLVQLRKESSRLLSLQEAAGWEFCPPEGESRKSVWKRNQNALLAAAEKWPKSTILVVAHEGVIKCLIYRLYGRRFLPGESPLLRAYHLHWLIHDGRSLRIEKINALELN